MATVNGLFSLPPCVLNKIFSYVTYDELTKKRVVSKTFNQKVKAILNEGFRVAEHRHARLAARIKGHLPKRESERRVHHLSKHTDILSAVETRLSLLNMTYAKYLAAGTCCFIPGKVLDEVFKILRTVDTNFHDDDEGNAHLAAGSGDGLKPHEILQELRDLSSMAMEHFDEHIMPRINTTLAVYRGRRPFGYGGRMYARVQASCALLSASLEASTSGSSDSDSSPPASPDQRVSRLEGRITELERENAVLKAETMTQRKENKRRDHKTEELSKRLVEQETKLSELSSQT